MSLGMLSNKLRKQREQHKSCTNCGDVTREYNEGGADASDSLNIKRPPSEDLGSNLSGTHVLAPLMPPQRFSAFLLLERVSMFLLQHLRKGSLHHLCMLTWEERVEGSAVQNSHHIQFYSCEINHKCPLVLQIVLFDSHHPQSDGIKRDAGGGYAVSVEEPEDSELSESEEQKAETWEETERLDQAEQDVARKRQRQPTEREQDAGDSEGHSESVTTGGRRKRQQIVAPERAYSRAKTILILDATRCIGNKTADGAAAVEPIQNPETASGLSLGVTSENNKSTDLVQVTTVRSVELSQDKVVRVQTTDVDDQAEAAKFSWNYRVE
ncbi:hypothetical protein NC653_019827 [Populus alba x Populus x berolinensis]|uniref:Uncharacterized protein n=1 Tax=Populus alba x Populus x berolinensis TaxID=444605 RepID=A0AAD6MJM6_9ROSI|nr:hypothetical protein NC653_019827 [Populus alba x Populus x berolinensis]